MINRSRNEVFVFPSFKNVMNGNVSGSGEKKFKFLDQNLISVFGGETHTVERPVNEPGFANNSVFL
jgi:hypothetical protein